MKAEPSADAGRVAGIGARLGAFVIDSVLSVVCALITGFRPGTDWYGLAVGLFFLGIELLFVAAVGQTPGMRAVGVAVVRASDHGRPRVGWVAVRTVLLATVLPALVVDTSGRAMHDRAAGTVMLHVR